MSQLRHGAVQRSSVRAGTGQTGTGQTGAGQAAAPLPRTRPGRGLLPRLLTITLLPVLIVGLMVTALLWAERVSALQAIDEGLASTVARILATTLDVSELPQVVGQLQAAVSAENVAFVDVRPAGGSTRFFRSKSPETDWALRAAYDAAMVNGPGNAAGNAAGKASGSQRFVFHDERQSLYRAAAGQVSDPGVRERLGGVAASLPERDLRYQVVRTGVYETLAGQRHLRLPGEAAPPGRLIFELGVGVSNADIEALLTRQQWLVALACALAVALAAGLAWRATGRIVRPLVKLTRAADRLSLGDLGEQGESVDLVGPARSVTELSELAGAIERLRISLSLAMTRLRPPGQRQP
ncbi:HAMP domain-containing protein [Deinococcus sp.]|uniref:HAMP domain-containing protein n=1 Tax=Deinococcus sp. TaxID=47478 RepID=UPI0025CD8E75|nr:HAMP domain-containing protein [Deinococcus sp.]